MWVIIFIAGIIVLFMSALLIAYLNLRDTVNIMKNTIDWQNKRYMACLEGWEKAIKSVEKVISLNDQIMDLNKQLYSELYDNKDNNNNDNNDNNDNNEEDDNNECE